MYLVFTASKDTYITNKIINSSTRATDANLGAASTLDLFKLYDETKITGETSPRELSRALIKFQLDDISDGKYIVDTLLLNNEEVIGSKRSFINVSKSGIGEKVYIFASENSLIYGIFAVLIAVSFGFLVNEVMRKINA